MYAPVRSGRGRSKELSMRRKRFSGSIAEPQGRNYVMRTTAFIVLALVLSLAGPAAAQEWDVYKNIQDGFSVNFPGQPRITEIDLDVAVRLQASCARVQRREGPRTIYGDRRRLQRARAVGIERAKSCAPGNAQCRQNAGVMGPGYWRHDMRGAVMFATSKLVLGAAKVTRTRVGVAGNGRRQLRAAHQQG